MRVVVLHGEVFEGATKDELDVLIQAEAVRKALSDLGHEPVEVSFCFDIRAVVDALHRIEPDLVFNLVEAIEGRGQFIHVAPAVLDYLGLPYTGSRTDAMFLTSNKLVAKKVLKAWGIATPPWFGCDDVEDDISDFGGSFIIKSVWEHASIGLSESSVVHPGNANELRREMERRRGQLGGECFAELYIEGREFDIAFLAERGGLQVLPPCEIQFEGYIPGKLRIVGYDAKWNEESFEYQHTPRCFEFSDEDKPPLDRMVGIAKDCWNIFGVRGYGRVDFRVDLSGRAWVLEVNANPCLSPDGGFVAGAQRTGLTFNQVIERIVEDCLRAFGL